VSLSRDCPNTIVADLFVAHVRHLLVSLRREQEHLHKGTVVADLLECGPNQKDFFVG
jgi:hypothetical protein